MLDPKNLMMQAIHGSMRLVLAARLLAFPIVAVLITFSNPAESASSLVQNVQSAVGIEPKGRMIALLEALPAPPVAPADLPTTTCQNTPLQFSNQDMRRNWVRAGMTNVLIYWATAHDGRRAADVATRCADMTYATNRLQSALGREPTGVIGEAEIQAIEQADARKMLDTNRGMFDRTLSKGGTLEEIEQFNLRWLTGPIVDKTAKTSPEAQIAVSREPTIFDYLPVGPSISAQACQQFRVTAQRTTHVRGLDFIQFDHTGPPPPVHWQQVWKRYPEITGWANKYLPKNWDCMSIPRLQAWLNSIGEPQDMGDRASTELTISLINTAREKLANATYSWAAEESKSDRSLDKSWRVNTNATAKTAEISTLRFGMTIDDAWARLPQALCMRDGNKIICQKGNGCQREDRAVSDKIPNRSNPSVQAQITALQKVLSECQADRDKSSFAASAMNVFGHAVRAAALKFDGGQLGIISARVDGAETFRDIATGRFGRPEIQSETSTHTSQQIVGWSGYCTGNDLTAIGTCKLGRGISTPDYATRNETSVHHRYIWVTPGFDVVEFEGLIELTRKRGAAR